MTLPPLQIALIGYGAIAQYVAKTLAGDPRLAVSHVIVRAGRGDYAVEMLGSGVTPVEDAAELPETVRLAADCGGHAALRAHGAAILSRGIDLLTVSNGALADAALAVELEDAAKGAGTQLRLLSGAIGAVDAIAAAAVGGLDRVTYTGRKPPAGWAGSPAEEVLDLGQLTEPAAHFKGTAREAALKYPKNANVAATVALAGLGLDRTEARLIADPTVSANIHQIEAEGAFGRLSFSIEGNSLPGSPRSSALTAMSVVRALHDMVDPVVV